MIPVYVINLERSPDRRAFMTEMLARAGVTPQFVRAADGRLWRKGPALLTKTEAAVIISHRKAWRRLLASDEEFAVVMEDDAHVGAGFAALLAADWRGRRFHAVKLETIYAPTWISRRGEPFGERALHELADYHYGAAGYLVSRDGARKMLRATHPLAEPIDHTLFGRRAIFEREIMVLQLVPAVIVQDFCHPAAASRLEIAKTHTEPDSRRLAEAALRVRPGPGARLKRELDRIVQQARRAFRYWPSMRRVVVPWR